MWSAPKRLLAAFPIDRRAVAGREDLGLSEARVRGAIAALEEIGFLARYEAEPGRRYQRTEEGLHRRPILFRFGEEYGVEFGKANARAHAARGTAPPARRPVPRVEQLPTILGRSTAVSPPTEPKNRLPELRLHQMMDARPAPQLAQKQNLSGSVLIMGEERRAESSSALEAALARLGRGLGL
jgi:hypothetical protein